MDIVGPDRYYLTFNAESFSVQCPRGTDKFSGIATSKMPKIYVVSAKNKPIYVGVTRQSMRNRLRGGWDASGMHGYHGYAWRYEHEAACLDIWAQRDAPDENPNLELETVEAEVVFLIRCAGQWPLSQTEIHFHPSTSEHRRAATEIASSYNIVFPEVAI